MKKIILLALMVPVVFCAGCSPRKEAPPETPEKTEYFDFTVEEFVEELSSDYLIRLKPLQSFTDEETSSTYAVYTYSTEDDTSYTKMFYYITYDNTTEKVSRINFSVDKSFMGDIKYALARYYYHTDAVVKIIDPSADVEKIWDSISFSTDETGSTSMYKGKNFTLLATNTESNFDSSFLTN